MENYKKHILRISGVIVVLLAIPLTVYLSRQVSRPSIQADVLAVDLLIQPQNSQMPPSSNYEVYIDLHQQQSAFARVVISYDPQKLIVSNLQGSDVMTDVIDMYSSSEGGVGRIVGTFAVPPEETMPTGIYKLFSFNLSSISIVNNDPTTLSFVVEETQIVDQTEVEYPLNPESAQITLNPAAATSTPTSTPTPTNTPTPRSTSTPTPRPTSTSTPTPTMPVTQNQAIIQGYVRDANTGLALPTAIIRILYGGVEISVLYPNSSGFYSGTVTDPGTNSYILQARNSDYLSFVRYQTLSVGQTYNIDFNLTPR